MSDHERWLQDNDRYLASALGWLRERLEQLGRAEPMELATTRVPETVEMAGSQDKRQSFWERLVKVEEPITRATALPPPSSKASAGAREAIPPPPAMVEAQSAERPPALILLARRMGLSEFEQHTLLLCAAMELDTRIAALCARAQQDANRPYPTFALALTLFDNAAWDIMSPERPLRYWRLIEINQPGAQPLITSALKADERIVNYIKGLNYLDDRLAPLTMPVGRPADALPTSQSKVADAVAVHVEKAARAASLPLFQLVGSDSASKLAVAGHIAARLGLTLYRLPADAVPLQTGDHETLVRLWQRESALMPTALYVDLPQLDRAASPQTVRPVWCRRR